MNRRSFLRGSTSAVAVAVGGGIVANLAPVALTELAGTQIYQSDLSSMIYNISPVETPFLTTPQMITVIKETFDKGARPPVHEWQTDTLESFK